MEEFIMNKCFIFIGGMIVGSAVTLGIIKLRSEQLSEENNEDNSDVIRMDDIVKRRKEKADKDEDEITEESPEIKTASDVAPKNPDIIEYASIAKNYDTTSDEEKPKKAKEKKSRPSPYQITYDEFDEKGYDIQTLIYHADGFLTDEENNLIENIESLVGFACLDGFGKNEDDPDTVYVRNEKLQTDYEILRVSTNYSDVDD